MNRCGGGRLASAVCEHKKAAPGLISVGDPAETLAETQYYNLTVVECASGAAGQVVLHNPARHCYFA